jgi:hypothetical protein
MTDEIAQHPFPIGKLVRFIKGRPLQNLAPGTYEVTRQLPTTAGERQYRVKSALEQHERVAKEHELEPA